MNFIRFFNRPLLHQFEQVRIFLNNPIGKYLSAGQHEVVDLVSGEQKKCVLRKNAWTLPEEKRASFFNAENQRAVQT